jgi:hypothetical protein
MERTVIKTVHGDEMDLIINHFGHILIHIDNYEEGDPDYGGDREISCSISLDKGRAIKLRDTLNELIEIMYSGSGTEYMREYLMINLSTKQSK